MTYDFWLVLVLAFISLAIVLFPYCVNLYKGQSIGRKGENFFIIIFSVFYILFIGLRDWAVGADTERYIGFFNYSSQIQSLEGYMSGVRDAGIGFFLLAKLSSLITSNEQFFLLVLAAIYILSCLKFIYNITNKNKLFFLFAFTACFFFYSMGINVLKSGIAIMLTLIGISMDIKNKRIKWLYFVLGFLFHASVILIVGAWLLVKRFKNLWFACWTWIVCTLLSISGIGLMTVIKLLNLSFVNAFLADFGFSGYIKGDTSSEYMVGFRWDFTFFSGIFIVIGVWMLKQIKDPFYKGILMMYIYLNAFFILAYDIPYSDRIGMLSWVLIPLIICTPFSKQLTSFTRKRVFLWYFFMFGIGVFSFFISYPK